MAVPGHIEGLEKNSQITPNPSTTPKNRVNYPLVFSNRVLSSERLNEQVPAEDHELPNDDPGQHLE